MVVTIKQIEDGYTVPTYKSPVYEDNQICTSYICDVNFNYLFIYFLNIHIQTSKETWIRGYVGKLINWIMLINNQTYWYLQITPDHTYSWGPKMVTTWLAPVT